VNRRDIVVIGGSAGAIEALRTLLPGLPTDLPAAVLLTVHTSANSSNTMPRTLQRWSTLPLGPAIDGEKIEPGRVYVATPDHHLLVHDGEIRLSRSARVNRVRPCVDLLGRPAWPPSRRAAA
jgi:two-component system, chemotaxis family, protein-glutamate methylesterase/glutaminase